MNWRGTDIICIGPVAWRGVWARPQQLMSRLLARGARILYVDPPVTVLSPLKDPRLRPRWTHPGSRLEAAGAGLENLWILEPPLSLPFGSKRRGVNRLNQQALAGALRRAAAHLGFRRPVLWTYLPGSGDLAPLFPHSLLVYDCVDDHAAFRGLLDPAVVEAMEADLVRRCQAVFATAEALRQKCARHRPDVVLVPNAADVEHFARAREAALPVPAEVARLPRPRLGFVGGVGEWIDLDIVAGLARSHPDWTLVLLGPVLTSTSPLEGLANVHLLGPRPYRDLPGYLKGFDACLNPFRVTRLTASVNPIKLYEYLAAGREVISTALPEVEGFREVINIARDGAGFLALTEAVVTGRLAHRAEDMEAAARANSWEERLSRMESAIEPALAKAGAGSSPGPSGRGTNPGAG